MSLRHSASQIFGSAHPALPRPESDDGALNWRGRRTAVSGQAAASVATQALNQDQNRTKSTTSVERSEVCWHNSPSPPPPPPPPAPPTPYPSQPTQRYTVPPSLEPRADAAKSFVDTHNAHPSHGTAVPSLEEIVPELAHFTPGPFSTGRMPIHSATPPFAPPSSQALQAAWGVHATQRDAASLHPVFFTARLQRSPFVVDSAATAMAITSPVAYGYAYPEKSRPGARL